MLTNLINIGEKLKGQLNEVGIMTPEDLYFAGSRKAWLMIYGIDSSACIMRLFALEGAIRGIRWKYLDETIKNDLRAFYKEAKSK